MQFLEGLRMFTATIQAATNISLKKEEELYVKLEAKPPVLSIQSKQGTKRWHTDYITLSELKNKNKSTRGKKKEVSKPKRKTSGEPGTMNAEIVFDFYHAESKSVYYLSLKRKGHIRIAGVQSPEGLDARQILAAFIHYLTEYIKEVKLEGEIKWILINYHFRLINNDKISINLYNLSNIIDTVASKYMRVGVIYYYNLIKTFDAIELPTKDHLIDRLHRVESETDRMITINVDKLYDSYKAQRSIEEIFEETINDNMYYYVRNTYNNSNTTITFEFYNINYRDKTSLLNVIETTRPALFPMKMTNKKSEKTTNNIECTSGGKFLVKGLKNHTYIQYIYMWVEKLLIRYKADILSP